MSVEYPSSLAFSSLIIRTAEAPSVNGEEEAAVTVPPASADRNTGFKDDT